MLLLPVQLKKKLFSRGTRSQVDSVKNYSANQYSTAVIDDLYAVTCNY